MKQCDIWKRLERLRVHNGWTWADLSRAIELSTGMLSMVKNAQRGLSRRAEHRLALLEQDAGITSQAALPSDSRADDVDSQGLAITDVRRELKAALADARKLCERIERLLEDA